MQITNKNKLKIMDYAYKDCNLDAKELAVILALIKLYNEEKGYAFPTREQLATLTRYSIPTIDRTIKSLSNKGYIVWNTGHKKKANEYKIVDVWSKKEINNTPKNCITLTQLEQVQKETDVYCGQLDWE